MKTVENEVPTLVDNAKFSSASNGGHEATKIHEDGAPVDGAAGSQFLTNLVLDTQQGGGHCGGLLSNFAPSGKARGTYVRCTSRAPLPPRIALEIAAL